MKNGDFRLIETGNGGDLVLKGNDLEIIKGFQNMPYIGLFGGNIEQPTTGAKKNEQTFDFWGNYLFSPSNSDIWFTSKTEKLLSTVALTSAGRIRIENQIKKDLQFIKQFATLNVSVSLVYVDRINIDIQIIEPSTNEVTEFTYIWDAMSGELENQSIGNQSGNGVALDFGLNFNL